MDIPEQKNDWDCGVFMLMFMKYTALNKKFDFDTSHMQFFREAIRKEIEDQQINQSNVNIEGESYYVSTSSSSESSVEHMEYKYSKNTEQASGTQSLYGEMKKNRLCLKMNVEQFVG